jgi:anti-sigma factor RsiW
MRIRGRFRRSSPVLSCEEVGALLQRFLDGELDEDCFRRVAAHLDDCRRCGLEAEVYAAVRSSLARRGAVEPESLARLRTFAAHLASSEEP